MPEQHLLDTYPCWQALLDHRRDMASFSMEAAFGQDNERAGRLLIEAAGLSLDYSKNLVSGTTLELLLQLAEQAGLAEAIPALLNGEPVNNTEQRAALHTALRDPEHRCPDKAAVDAAYDRMETLAEAIRNGEWKGYEGQAITDVVNIGIGGSDLGPKMACRALEPYRKPGLQCHFVSNVDPSHIEGVLKSLKPETTLFIIASKTFTTLETLQNAEAARQWMLPFCGEAGLSRHFVAVSTAIDKAGEFGIPPDNILPLWDWVGGRYSLWSAIGLPIAIATGMTHFRQLLAGAHAMDQHFRDAPFASNMPVIMALLGIWYSHFWDAQTHAVLPYEHHLTHFPDFLQQLDMESNGKSVRRDGSLLNYPSGPVIWGAEGTNGQHSFHQLLHQGRRFIPADFILALQSHSLKKEQHRHLVANCLAQSQALMSGKNPDAVHQELRQQGISESDIEALAPHKLVPGNRPSNTLFMPSLTPASLGALIALYEHKVYVQSVIWKINAFDQWGVELGKQLSKPLFSLLSGNDDELDGVDPSTRQLVLAYRKQGVL